MRHIKRKNAPISWPIPRKGSKYIIKPNFGLNNGLPLVIALRDLLKIAKTRKEIKGAIHEKNILLNGRAVRDEKENIQLFDTITLVPTNKHYELFLSDKKKFDLKEIKTKIDKKVVKIIDKKMLKGKKIQINLADGRNFLSDIICKVNDSVIVDLKNKKIEKCIPLKEGVDILVIDGKHAGEKGKLLKIKTERKMISFKNEGKEVDILIKQVMAIN
jgi:small subunit ribosomal protein S4e